MRWKCPECPKTWPERFEGAFVRHLLGAHAFTEHQAGREREKQDRAATDFERGA